MTGTVAGLRENAHEKAVSVHDLSFSYSGGTCPVLEDVNFDVLPGEFVCVLGQSGCGKSTLLRLIAGLEKPSRGEILLYGKRITGAGLDRGIVFQDYGLFPWMTAGANIRLALEQKFPGLTKSQYTERTLQALRQVGLPEDTDRKLPKSLSGGQRQRVAIAQVFASDPSIMLMDEPFGALDAVTRARLQDMLLSLWAGQSEKKTVIFVTHDVDEAMLLAGRIIVVGDGGIMYDRAIPESIRPTRETQFEDINALRLRNELIRCINSARGRYSDGEA